MKPIPTRQACFDLWKNYHTPENVRQHLLGVEKVAVFLGESLLDAGENFSLPLVQSGALLHDWLRLVGVGEIKLKHFKTPPSYEDFAFWRELNQRFSGLNHSQAAAMELTLQEYPAELAEVVARHDYSSIIDPEHKPATWEQKLVFYADKRVMHDQVVTLRERFEDGRQRYPEFADGPGATLKQAAVYELEHEIFDILKFPPDDLREAIQDYTTKDYPAPSTGE